ncbi:MAG: hypothetical protein L0H93_03750 [Nocardioides sp.]|nr:hypothetical protein [Nocardioides sp.]
MVSALPLDAGRMAWWLSAWLRGDASPDDVLSAVVGGDAAHDVMGLPGQTATTPLVLALGPLQRLGARSAGLALPVPGDLCGLGGPRPFNEAALEAGEAVVLEGTEWGLVPHRAGAGVVWRLLAAHRRPLTDLGEADRSLRTTLVETADTLVDLEVARWRPEVADELMNLRHVPHHAAPHRTPDAAVDLVGRGLQALAIVDLALEDVGGAVTAQESMRREDALRPLERAGRQAVVAACSPEAWPPGKAQ